MVYRLLYPWPDDSLERLAVYFDFQQSGEPGVEDYAMDLWKTVEELWLAKNQVGSLFYEDDGKVLHGLTRPL